MDYISTEQLEQMVSNAFFLLLPLYLLNIANLFIKSEQKKIHPLLRHASHTLIAGTILLHSLLCILLITDKHFEFSIQSICLIVAYNLMIIASITYFIKNTKSLLYLAIPLNLTLTLIYIHHNTTFPSNSLGHLSPIHLHILIALLGISLLISSIFQFFVLMLHKILTKQKRSIPFPKLSIEKNEYIVATLLLYALTILLLCFISALFLNRPTLNTQHMYISIISWIALLLILIARYRYRLHLKPLLIFLAGTSLLMTLTL